MKNLRFWWGDILVCLPLAVLVAGGIFFFRAALPGFVEREAERVEGAYRAIAVALKDGEVSSARAYGRGESKAIGRIGKGTWGTEPHSNGILVWYRPAKSSTRRGTVVQPIVSFDYVKFFRWTGLAVLVLMLVLTDMGLRSFRRLTRERDDFLAAAAHDLRTPLVGMRRLIGRNDDEARQLAERMLHLIENINDFLKLGGKRRPEIHEVAVARVFDETYRLFAADYAELESGPITVTGDRSLKVLADERQLVQIMWNLIGNDLKYAAPYGPVAVRFVADAKRVAVEFADAGPGMSAAERRRAFNRYYRARTILQSGKGGFGIGLCTSREFARAMGGDLTVLANEPSGTIFTLTLPRASESEAEA